MELKKRYEVKKKAPARKQLKLDANFNKNQNQDIQHYD